jgi:hypothetical protein
VCYEELWWWFDPYGKEEEERLAKEVRIAQDEHEKTLDLEDLQEIYEPWRQ